MANPTKAVITLGAEMVVPALFVLDCVVDPELPGVSHDPLGDPAH